MNTCYCDHAVHALDADTVGSFDQIVGIVRDGHIYLDAPAGDRQATWVGPVCDECADTHLSRYLV